MWLVPILMIVTGVALGALAASDDRWGLFAFMVFMVILGLALLFLHWWLLYRFGKAGGES
jgi:hypothetical protein